MTAPKLGTPCTGDCHQPREDSNQSHCTVCHLTLSSVFLFDRHRSRGRCRDLAKMGLTENKGVWTTPQAHATFAARTERMRNSKNRGTRPSLPTVDGLTALPGMEGHPGGEDTAQDDSGGSR